MSQIIRKLNLKFRPKRTTLLEDWAFIFVGQASCLTRISNTFVSQSAKNPHTFRLKSVKSVHLISTFISTFISIFTHQIYLWIYKCTHDIG